MKKLILFLVLSLTISFISCKDVDDPRTVGYEADSILVISSRTNSEKAIEANTEIENILSILNDSDWEEWNPKITHDFVFTFDGSEQKLHYYSPYGVFNDWERKRHLTLSDEQREMINSILNTMFDESDLGEP